MVIGEELRKLKGLCDAEDASWWPLIHRVIPEDVMEQVLDDTGSREKRRRKLTAKTMLLFVIAMGLFTEECSEQVYASMIEGLRFLYPEIDGTEPKKGGFAKRATVWARNPWSSCSGAFVVR